jgi:hypothetical protein
MAAHSATPGQVTPATYDPHVSALSTKKRTRGFVIKPGREPATPISTNETIPIHKDATRSNSLARTAPHEVTARVYSFGKAEKAAVASVSTSSPITALDVDRAARYVQERPSGGTFSKESRLQHTPPSSSSSSSGESCETVSAEQRPKRSMNLDATLSALSGAGAGAGSTSDLDKLSHRTRAPVVKMAPDSTKAVRRLKIDRSDLGTPGPGAYYDVSSTVGGPSSALGRKKSGSFGSTSHVIPLASRAVIAQQKYRPSPGPGEYEVERADSVTKSSIGSGSGKGSSKHAFSSSASDSKPTPQLVKKRYFEDKARDMREETDGLRAVDFSHVTARTPFTAKLHPTTGAGESAKQRQIEKRREVMAERASEGQTVLDVQACYAATEKRAVASVHMGQQVKAAASTRRRLEQAGIPDQQARDALEKAQRDAFLGPQLPAPWGEDRLAAAMVMAAATRGQSRGDEQDEDEDEEVREALAILQRREQPPVDRPPSKKEADREDLAAAFLRSSHTGLTRKPAILMDVPLVKPRTALRHEGDVLTREQRNMDFLPTQVT